MRQEIGIQPDSCRIFCICFSLHKRGKIVYIRGKRAALGDVIALTDAQGNIPRAINTMRGGTFLYGSGKPVSLRRIPI
jgi:hypothetical protein